TDRSSARAGGQPILPRCAMASRVATENQSSIHRALPPFRGRRQRQVCMTDTFITSDETDAFLRANPNVAWIDLIVFDINGIPRGKRFRRSDLQNVAKNGVMMPTTVFLMDARGNCV